MLSKSRFINSMISCLVEPGPKKFNTSDNFSQGYQELLRNEAVATNKSDALRYTASAGEFVDDCLNSINVPSQHTIRRKRGEANVAYWSNVPPV